MVPPVGPAGRLSIVQRRRPRLFCFRFQQVVDGQLGCPVHIPGLLAALPVQLQQPGAGRGVEGSGQGSGFGRRLALPLGVMLYRGPFRESRAFRPQQGIRPRRAVAGPAVADMGAVWGINDVRHIGCLSVRCGRAGRLSRPWPRAGLQAGFVLGLFRILRPGAVRVGAVRPSAAWGLAGGIALGQGSALPCRNRREGISFPALGSRIYGV